MRGIKFGPGSIVATPGALAAVEASGDDPMAYLVRHIAGDWGDIDEYDRRENELSLIHGFRLLSVYRCPASSLYLNIPLEAGSWSRYGPLS